MKLRFNEERAVQLFTILQDLWNRKAGIFEGIVLPQDRWPVPEDPREAANYFSYAAITQRGGVVSEDPFKWVNYLRTTHPELFDPCEVAERWTIPQIMDVIAQAVTDRNGWFVEPEQTSLFQLCRPEKKLNGKNEKLYKLDEFAASWHRNSITLAQRWDGNALNIFAGVSDFEEAFARIDYKSPNNNGKLTFSGIRRKIFALFTIWLQEKKIIPAWSTPIPVDFHALRILFATWVVRPRRKLAFVATPGIHPLHMNDHPILRVTEKITDAVALWSQPFMVKHGFSHLAINPALWVLSRELCRHEFQNQSTGRGRLGSRRSLQLVYPEVLKAEPWRWPFPYNDPAQVCPVAELCKLAIPNSPYYSFGLLALLKRLSYPHPSFSEVRRVLHPRRRRNNRK